MARERANWSREETILAFELYCRTPFGRIHHNNKDIQELAALIGRTPSAVAYKMQNPAHHDPELQKRNVTALSHGSKLDAQIFREFSDDWEGLILHSQEIRAKMMHVPVGEVLEMDDLPTLPAGVTHEQLVKARVGQYFFRTSVLSAYRDRCCITQMKLPRLLIASHIKPWSQSNEKTERTDPSNGLALNPFHDKAFDSGYITIDTEYRVIISSQLKEVPMDLETREWFMGYDHKSICLPDKFLPGKRYIEFHNDTVFLGPAV